MIHGSHEVDGAREDLTGARGRLVEIFAQLFRALFERIQQAE
jgi:hypothetical protein